jgi:hypothetical protein
MNFRIWREAQLIDEAIVLLWLSSDVEDMQLALLLEEASKKRWKLIHKEGTK